MDALLVTRAGRWVAQRQVLDADAERSRETLGRPLAWPGVAALPAPQRLGGDAHTTRQAGLGELGGDQLCALLAYRADAIRGVLRHARSITGGVTTQNSCGHGHGDHAIVRVMNTQLVRFEIHELSDRWTVVDLEAERLASPRRAWSRSDAELVASVLVERPGYALQLPWRSAR